METELVVTDHGISLDIYFGDEFSLHYDLKNDKLEKAYYVWYDLQDYGTKDLYSGNHPIRKSFREKENIKRGG